MENLELKKIALKIRRGIIEAVYAGKSGHPGGSLSCADILTYLYFEKMNIDINNPKWDKRDRFVLSKGHATPLYYSILANRGFFDVEKLKTFRCYGSILQGHPDMKNIPGVDMSTGSLGQGISAACGMALSGRIFNISYKVYSVLGDGELQEGEVWEAFMFAAAKKLDNLCIFIDNNGLQIDGDIEDVCSPYPIADKLKAFNFNVFEIDGHNFNEIREAVNKSEDLKNKKPTAIIAKTTKGRGISYMENQASWHGKAPNDEEYKIALNELKKLEEELCSM